MQSLWRNMQPRWFWGFTAQYEARFSIDNTAGEDGLRKKLCNMVGRFSFQEFLNVAISQFPLQKIYVKLSWKMHWKSFFVKISSNSFQGHILRYIFGGDLHEAVKLKWGPSHQLCCILFFSQESAWHVWNVSSLLTNEIRYICIVVYFVRRQ